PPVARVHNKPFTQVDRIAVRQYYLDRESFSFLYITVYEKYPTTTTTPAGDCCSRRSGSAGFVPGTHAAPGGHGHDHRGGHCHDWRGFGYDEHPGFRRRDRAGGYRRHSGRIRPAGRGCTRLHFHYHA